MLDVDSHPTTVIGGVDTHADTHTVAAISSVGRVLGTETFPATARGYRDLLAWLHAFGIVIAIGLEGTGSYGAGVARYLTHAGAQIVEVDRANRQARRRHGKTDDQDAINAARAVLAETATGTPKTRDGIVEAIRVLRTTRSGAIKARTAAMNQLHGVITSAPEDLRAHLVQKKDAALIDACVRLRPHGELTNPTQATKRALVRLARRVRDLSTEIAEADRDIDALTAHIPRLRAAFGVGPDSAASLLIACGDNPGRLHSEASLAALCGVSPIPVSSGRTDRYRLNRGGNRDANRALHMIVLTRLRTHQPTRDYAERRTEEGKPKRAIMRCLKRYLVRELLPLIRDALDPAQTLENAARQT